MRHKTTEIEVCAVKVGYRRRAVRGAEIGSLAESIAELGLLNPITVTADFNLVAGAHRLAACKALGWTSIPVRIVDIGSTEAALAEIDENLCRNELTALERCEHLAERKQLYEALYPETKKGVAGAKAKHGAATDKLSFAESTANRTGESARNVRRDIAVAEKLSREVRAAIRNTPVADSKEELKRLAKLDSGEQLKVAEVLAAGDAEKVQAAMRLVRHSERRAFMLTEGNTGRYRVIYADPPWQYENSGFSGAPEDHYPTMPTADICELPVVEISEDDAALFLWATNPHLPDAMRVMAAWGFEYRTKLTWVKDRPTGLGFYVHGLDEVLLLGIRGNNMLPEYKPHSVVNENRTCHSAKPERFYELIEAMYPGLSRIELFARNTREGWAQWGNEPSINGARNAG